MSFSTFFSSKRTLLFSSGVYFSLTSTAGYGGQFTCDNQMINEVMMRPKRSENQALNSTTPGYFLGGGRVALADLTVPLDPGR